jgi:septal ring factor EnvC (AmiA/AmiB activator)
VSQRRTGLENGALQSEQRSFRLRVLADNVKQDFVERYERLLALTCRIARAGAELEATRSEIGALAVSQAAELEELTGRLQDAVTAETTPPDVDLLDLSEGWETLAKDAQEHGPGDGPTSPDGGSTR